MTRKVAGPLLAWDDVDTPEWTDDQLDHAELTIGGKVVRPAVGKLTRAGRPPLGDATKRQVTLRIDPDAIDNFHEGGPDWQGRMNEALQKAVGL